MSKCNLIIAGAGGRMGRAVITSALNTHQGHYHVAGAFDRPDSDYIGIDTNTCVGLTPGGVKISDSIRAAISSRPKGPVIVVDFTTPDASIQNAQFCAENNLGYVVGTTGFADKDEAAISKAAAHIPIVKSGNMSTGIAVLSALVEQAAAHLKSDFDIEITEAHHRAKVDAPSGTGLMLGAAAAQGRQVDITEKSVRTRDGITGPRKEGDIGFSVIRGGGIIGDHQVMFASNNETITLAHHAIDRKLFADGALRAARWLAQNGADLQAPGLYSMGDVLGLNLPKT